MNFLDLIKSDGYITVSKELAREIGLQETIILSELISQYEYFRKRNELDQEGYFYCTVNKMEKCTTLGEKAQKRAIDNLVKLNLIENTLKGLPAKRHFKINEEEILKLFFNNNPEDPRHVQILQNVASRSEEKSEQDTAKPRNINNNNYNNEKIEEEDAQKEKEEFIEKTADKIISKYEQIFDRKLSAEFYQKLIGICADPNVIYKALLVAEEKADKPGWLLKTLRDWKEKNLNSIKSIDRHLEKRKTNNRGKKYKRNDKQKELHNIDKLKTKGWNQ